MGSCLELRRARCSKVRVYVGPTASDSFFVAKFFLWWGGGSSPLLKVKISTCSLLFVLDQTERVTPCDKQFRGAVETFCDFTCHCAWLDAQGVASRYVYQA